MLDEERKSARPANRQRGAYEGSIHERALFPRRTFRTHNLRPAPFHKALPHRLLAHADQAADGALPGALALRGGYERQEQRFHDARGEGGVRRRVLREEARQALGGGGAQMRCVGWGEGGVQESG